MRIFAAATFFTVSLLSCFLVQRASALELTTPGPTSSTCNLSQTLPGSDTYWTLGDADLARCAGFEKEKLLGRLFSLAAKYIRFENTLEIDFNPAADCGSGDGSTTRGCPKGVTFVIKSDALKSDQTCFNSNGKDDDLEISQKLNGQLGPFQTFRFLKADRNYSISIESPQATCLVEVKDFKPDTRR